MSNQEKFDIIDKKLKNIKENYSGDMDQKSLAIEYWHNSSFATRTGDIVEKGTKLCYSGNTGLSFTISSKSHRLWRWSCALGYAIML
jgi:hypothetical protein